MIHEFLAHADPSILDIEFIIGITGRRPLLFRDPHSDNPACARILDGIAKEI